MNQQANNNTVVLETGLFEDRVTLDDALSELNIPESNRYTVKPESMNDGDWDKLLSLVLSAKRVITV